MERAARHRPREGHQWWDDTPPRRHLPVLQQGSGRLVRALARKIGTLRGEAAVAKPVAIIVRRLPLSTGVSRSIVRKEVSRSLHGTVRMLL